MRRTPLFLLVAAVVSSVLAAGTFAQHRRIGGAMPVGAGGVVNLPYSVNDNAGNQWFIYQGGWVQMQGNNPVYSQAAMLQINGNQPSMRNNQARIDEKTGEVLFENMQAQGFLVTRRIFPMRDEGVMRYIEVIKNPQGAEQQCNVTITTNVNFGVQNAEIVPDPRRKGQNLAWVAQTHGNNRTAVEVFAGKGAKVSPTINWQQGNNTVTATMSVTVPAGKEVAIMHLRTTAPNSTAGVQWVGALKESQLLKNVPAELRRVIVNFVSGAAFIGDRELLRGELFDVIELRGGDQMKGTLKEPAYTLETFYGTVELPVERVIALMNVGEFRPRQLLVTIDGEIFGGKLSRDTLAMELTSGQVTQVPLSQVSRAGYRKRPNEPEEWTFDKPFVMMRSGDRVAVEMPAEPFAVVTRYGPLSVDPKTLAAIVFQSDEHGVHEILLNDGSHFAGLVGATQYDMKLSGTGGAAPEQVVKFPVSGISRMQFVAEVPEIDESMPTLKLVNDDELVGSLTGTLKLDTAFDTLTVDAAQIHKLAHAAEGGLDVQLTLWDQSIVSGQLQQPQVQCTLNSGLVLSVPVALIEEYEQPEPAASSAMVEKIKQTVARLNAEDWKERDQAVAELTEMGTVVAPVLRQMRPDQPPEAQQRIDQVLGALAQSKPAAPRP